ncbi:asparagine synthase (glutamine-hydrolyzing) [Adhaeribacter soli]|uniref:asparagine synthase (glutamine-hydrolyzing) n=1 Tax=Adhaeribacter soli TaxID=2607655 RepID=A0A5N1IIB4_9BACT|nr:asparagine synthase (glutamine-hydrolyzing) [Adhaeribacter soli]KAA9325405.1 asparagine synthase (glutamine-hydrolyzing) [Adhaeribacter soli]
MCGLNVIIDKNSSASPELISRMNRATKHRGPDSTALYVSRHENATVYFGHNRLKIIDCSDAANQPFFSPDGRYLLLYNGEIYNYQSLRSKLQQQGIVFRTLSDTEVILHLLMLEGKKGLEQLNGMFALVFYDTATKALIAARDRFGLKPLYYAETPNHFIISSEIKGILATGLVQKELNESQLAEYLTFRHARKPQTFFQNISELEEGTFGLFHKDTWKINTYVPALTPQNELSLRPESIIQQTQELLQNAVTRQLQADVPVGLFLSGGIDSTLLLALIADSGHMNFPAFSVVNKASESAYGSDDYKYAKLAARKFGASHTVFEIDDNILAGTIPLVEAMDQPIADGAALLTGFLSEKSRKTIKVALSGAGADELFGGYNRHRAFYKYLHNRKLLLLAKPFLKTASHFLPTGVSHPLRKEFQLIRKLATKIQRQPDRTFISFTTMEMPLRQTYPYEAASYKEANFNKAPGSRNEWLRWTLQRDQHQYLISDILAMTDQVSMMHGLEVRAPYLDNELCQFVNKLQPELLFRFGQKWILKDLLKLHGGEDFTLRGKEGFGMPLGLWLKKPKNQFLLEPLQNPKHIIFRYLDFQQTKALIQAHLNSRQDLSAELWALISLAIWLQKHFGE